MKVSLIWVVCADWPYVGSTVICIMTNDATHSSDLVASFLPFSCVPVLHTTFQQILQTVYLHREALFNVMMDLHVVNIELFFYLLALACVNQFHSVFLQWEIASAGNDWQVRLSQSQISISVIAVKNIHEYFSDRLGIILSRKIDFPWILVLCPIVRGGQLIFVSAWSLSLCILIISDPHREYPDHLGLQRLLGSLPLFRSLNSTKA